MTPRNIINIISQTYAPLSLECQQEFADSTIMQSLGKKTTLVRENQFSDKAFFIISGCARAYYLKDGKSVSDWFAFENDFISSIVSFFDNKPSPHYIELLEDSMLIEFSRETIEHLSNKYHDFEHLMRVVVTRTMLAQQERIASLQFQSAEMKYECLLDIYPNITQRVALTHIASYLGITLETLSRIRNPKKRI